MLIPQFSIRWLLGLTAVCAIVSLIVARAIAGSGWAVGVTIALVATIVALAVHVIFFAGIWLIGELMAAPGRARAKSEAARLAGNKTT